MMNEFNFDSILAAAIREAVAEAEKRERSNPVPPPEDKPKQTEGMKRAQALREIYESFLAVGFDEEQATAFVCAILN